MNYEKKAEQWLKHCSDHRGEQVLSLSELLSVSANEARLEALEQAAQVALWHTTAEDCDEATAAEIAKRIRALKAAPLDPSERAT